MTNSRQLTRRMKSSRDGQTSRFTLRTLRIISWLVKRTSWTNSYAACTQHSLSFGNGVLAEMKN